MHVQLLILVVISTATFAKVPFQATKSVSWEDVVNSVDPNLDNNWIATNAPDGWHMPLMSYNAKGRWANYILGNDVIYPEWDDMCIMENWKYSIAIFTGWGQTQPAKCSGDNGAWNCTYWSENHEPTKAMVFISLSDNKDFCVEVRVWDNGETDWIAFTEKNKLLTTEQKETILKHAESLGLTTASAFAVDYTKCDVSYFAGATLPHLVPSLMWTILSLLYIFG